MRALISCLLVAALFATILPAADKKSAARNAAEQAYLRKESAKLSSKHCKNVEKVARWAASKGLRDEAIRLYKRVRSLDRSYKGLKDLKKTIQAADRKPGKDADADALMKSLAKKESDADKKHAAQLYDFALKSFKFGLYSRSFDLLHQVLELAPDPKNSTQKKAQKILGFTYDRKSKEWISTWTKNQRKKYYLTDEGWVLKKDKKKWDGGQRKIKGKWVSKEREHSIRTRNEYNPYQVETEHFVVKSNLGRKEAWEYALLLEDFNAAFYRFFIGYYDQVEGAKLLFKRGAGKKHQVYVFPDRKKYLIHVKENQGNTKLLLESAGFYSQGDQISRFYWSENVSSTLDTLYHEVAHQLFAETKPGSRGGNAGNNWIVEGIASYVETWENKNGKWYPGRKTDTHHFAQTIRFLKQASPGWLEAFVAKGHEDFHGNERGLNYSLGCCLCHFFLHYDDEVYKEDFIRLLSGYYAGKLSRTSLTSYLSAAPDFATLESQFLKYMKKI
ncbi:MAG: hypothetical protein AAF517_01425 [Planctomycetota bacterium]